MASVLPVIFLEHARQARDRAERWRMVARKISDPSDVEWLEAFADELDLTAAQLENLWQQ
jgi:hypothetical protein